MAYILTNQDRLQMDLYAAHAEMLAEDEQRVHSNQELVAYLEKVGWFNQWKNFVERSRRAAA